MLNITNQPDHLFYLFIWLIELIYNSQAKSKVNDVRVKTSPKHTLITIMMTYTFQ